MRQIKHKSRKLKAIIGRNGKKETEFHLCLTPSRKDKQEFLPVYSLHGPNPFYGDSLVDHRPNALRQANATQVDSSGFFRITVVAKV